MHHKNLIKIFIVVTITFAKSCKFPCDTGLVKSVQEIDRLKSYTKRVGVMMRTNTKLLYFLD